MLAFLSICGSCLVLRRIYPREYYANSIVCLLLVKRHLLTNLIVQDNKNICSLIKIPALVIIFI